MVRSVDHDGSKAVVDRGFARFKIGAVVEVHDDGDVRRFDGRLDEVLEVNGVGVLSRSRGYLQDERGIAFLARFHDTLNGFHVVHVERADRIAAGIRFSEHFGRCYQRHKTKPP